ncbi:SelB C-terminal domain-containing protein [Chloroflexota bacterium]
MQTHKTRVDTVAPGSRVAVNLVGVATSRLRRGDVLTSPGLLMPATMLSVQLRLLPYLRRPLLHNAAVSFHTGSAEAMAKVRLLEKEKLEPGGTAWAQLVLSESIALVNGDYFIIRSTMETLGGGKVVDAHAKRLRRFRPPVIQGLKARAEGTAEESIIALLETKQPLASAALLAQCDLPIGEARPALESLIRQAEITGVGQGEHCLLFTAIGWERLIKQATTVLQDYHRRFPVRSGMPKVELGSRMRLGKHSPAVWQKLFGDGVFSEEGLTVRLPSHRIQLTAAQQAKIDAFLQSLSQNPYAPPADRIPEPDLLNLLVERHQVVKVSGDVVFSASAYKEMVEKVTVCMKSQGKVTLAEVRDLFKTSRKYTQAFLDYLDEKKITRRIGDERVLY